MIRYTFQAGHYVTIYGNTGHVSDMYVVAN